MEELQNANLQLEKKINERRTKEFVFTILYSKLYKRWIDKRPPMM